MAPTNASLVLADQLLFGSTNSREGQLVTAETPWNSLEIAKLVVDALITISIFALGAVLAWAVRRSERRQWLNQRLVERRLALITDLGPGLNKLYCYFMRVGEWRSITPPEVMTTRRDLDQLVAVSLPVLSSETVEAYLAFMETLLETHRGAGLTARLRTSIEPEEGDRRLILESGWNPDWNHMFSEPDGVSSDQEVLDRYRSLIHALGESIGLEDSVPMPAPRPALN